MTPMQGMSPDEVHTMARSLLAQAQRLGSIEASLESLLSGLRWTGADADQLHAMWGGTGRRSLSVAAESLRGAAQRLTTEISQQEGASQATGRSIGGNQPVGGESASRGRFSEAAGLGALRAVPGAVSLLGEGLESVDHVRSIIERMSDLGKNRQVIGDYTKAWHAAISAGDSLGFPSDLLRFKRSPVFQVLNSVFSPIEGPLSAIADNKLIAGLGNAMGWVSVGSHGVEALRSLGQHHYVDAALSAGDTTADVLKTKGPVGYLGGVAVQTWAEVGRAAQDIDWSPKGWEALTHLSASDWGCGFKYSVTHLPLVKIFL